MPPASAGSLFSGTTIDMKHYVPAALGNGALSLLVDRRGSSRTRSFCGDQIRTGIQMAGGRYDKPNFPLIPFGYFFDPFEDEEPLNWRQTFDITGAKFDTECAYRDGSVGSGDLPRSAPRLLRSEKAPHMNPRPKEPARRHRQTAP